MALFDWVLSGTGDWTTPGNWNLLLGSGTAPPGSGDFAFFADAGAAYTVNVTTTVDVGQIQIIPTTSTASFSISGSLTTGALTFDTSQTISMTVDAGGLLHVTNALDSLGSPLETIAISGTGAGGRVELGDFFSVGLNVAFTFNNSPTSLLNTGVMQFDNVPFGSDAVFRSLITNVAQGDEFVVTGADFTGDTLDFASGVLTVANRLGDTQFEINNLLAMPGTTFELVGSDTIEAVCFFAGTMIACPDGERAVETLSIGDRVLTSDGRVMPVCWIGRNTVSTKFADPLRVLPIRIAAGALADHLPVRDLLVSPKHAVLVDDILVQAGALVNGLSIVRESNVAETFVYYHIELAEHALVLAEGTPAESFVDNIERTAFDNWEEHQQLYGDAPIAEMDYPRVRSYRQVPVKVRARLLHRAETMLAARLARSA